MEFDTDTCNSHPRSVTFTFKVLVAIEQLRDDTGITDVQFPSTGPHSKVEGFQYRIIE